MRTFPFLIFALVLLGCEPLPPADNRPPRLVDTEVSESGTELALDFDEPLAEATATGNFSAVPTARVEGERVKVPLPPNLKPGKDYRWSAEVKDAGRNLTSVAGRFYGPNDHPAQLRINEVRIAGSGIHTDLVELRVESPGSLGGWTVDAYAAPDSRQRLVLPDRAVEAGELVVVHYKPTGDPAEKDETVDSNASDGSDTDPSAWDFWQPEGKGLSAVKGLVALRPRPDSSPIDALLYSKAAGEGAPLAKSAGWSGRLELNPDGCTATRTWSRTNELPPTWIITANGGATPGKPNKLIPWSGPTSTPKTPSRTKGRPYLRRKRQGPTRQSGPWSKPKPGVAEAGPFRNRSKGDRTRKQSGALRGNPGRRWYATQARLVPAATKPSARARPAPDQGGRRKGGEEGPPLRYARSGGPPPPGIGRAGNRRREAARPVV